jgi:hypothetical protein
VAEPYDYAAADAAGQRGADAARAVLALAAGEITRAQYDATMAALVAESKAAAGG